MANFWRRFISFGSGASTRTDGLQLGEPASYRVQSSTPVTVDSSLQLSAVWACVKLIAETVASLPVYVYKYDKTTGIKTRYVDHPLQELFDYKVNRWQTRQEFFESVVYQLVLLGNSYCAIQRNSQKRIIALIPLMSEQMEVSLEDGGAVVYKYTDGANLNFYSDKTVWHNKQFGNGVIGLSTLAYARNSIGIGQGAEETVSKIYRNGGKPSGILTIDKVLSAQQREQIKNNFAELQSGNQDRLFVLEAGMNYTKVSLSPEDIELLSSRKFQIEDIARFFGVPSVLINDTSSGTTWGSGIQQIVEGWYKLGLMPLLDRLEASMKCRLLSPEEQMNTTVEFDLDSLLQPSQAERVKTYKEAVTGGVMTPNEARINEGWTPLEGGNNLYMQQQMIPLKDLQNMQSTQNNVNQTLAEAKKIQAAVKPAAPVYNITMPDIRMEAPINVAAPHITMPPVENHFEMQAPVVNVTTPEQQAPVVNVTLPEMTPNFAVDVKSPDVHVEAQLPAPEVQVILPARKTETKVTYDAMDRIVSSTQIETDA